MRTGRGGGLSGMGTHIGGRAGGNNRGESECGGKPLRLYGGTFHKGVAPTWSETR